MTEESTRILDRNSRETAGYSKVGLAVWRLSEGADFERNLPSIQRAPAGHRKGTQTHRSPGYWSPNIAETRRKPWVVTGCSSQRPCPPSAVAMAFGHMRCVGADVNENIHRQCWDARSRTGTRRAQLGLDHPSDLAAITPSALYSVCTGASSASPSARS